jgi:tetratricopeptide (TPR) repeat protein
MKFTKALLTLPDVNIFQVDFEPGEFEDLFENDHNFSLEEPDFYYWEAEPVNAEILAAEYLPDNVLEGYFVLKALFISEKGETFSCFVDVTMPERISEFAFFIIDGKIHKESKGYSKCTLKTAENHIQGEVVPLVAIDKFGIYDLYYSRIRPEIGIEILRDALKTSQRKKYIAADLAYILRDENRCKEAIQAFDITIAEGADNEYCFLERADLFEKIGDYESAEKDKMSAREFILNRSKHI